LCSGWITSFLNPSVRIGGEGISLFNDLIELMFWFSDETLVKSVLDGAVVLILVKDKLLGSEVLILVKD